MVIQISGKIAFSKPGGMPELKQITNKFKGPACKDLLFQHIKTIQYAERPTLEVLEGTKRDTKPTLEQADALIDSKYKGFGESLPDVAKKLEAENEALLAELNELKTLKLENDGPEGTELK